MHIGLVRPEDVNTYWNQIQQLVEDACQYNGGRYSSQDCLEELLEGKKQLWLIFDGSIKAIVITVIIPFPQKKCCMIDICTGSGLSGWLELLVIIEQWAIENSCQHMFFVARPGFEKCLKAFGYVKTHVFLEKSL